MVETQSQQPCEQLQLAYFPCPFFYILLFKILPTLLLSHIYKSLQTLLERGKVKINTTVKYNI